MGIYGEKVPSAEEMEKDPEKAAAAMKYGESRMDRFQAQQSATKERDDRSFAESNRKLKEKGLDGFIGRIDGGTIIGMVNGHDIFITHASSGIEVGRIGSQKLHPREARQVWSKFTGEKLDEPMAWDYAQQSVRVEDLEKYASPYEPPKERSESESAEVSALLTEIGVDVEEAKK